MSAAKPPVALGPVFGGLLPDQIQYLKEKLFVGDVSVHPKHNWPYISGARVLDKLNKAFGFDGWSTRNIKLHMVDKLIGIAGKDKEGNPQIRSVMIVTLELVIQTPGGRTFVRAGFGADEKASKNLIDTIDNSGGSALTYAIRNAAITLGHQFGLAVMRMKVKDANGRVIDWRRLCSDKRPKLPDLVLLAQILNGQTTLPDGRTFDPTTGVVDEPEDDGLGHDDEDRGGGDRDDDGAPFEDGDGTSGGQDRKPEPEPEKKREPTPEERLAARRDALRDECANLPFNIETTNEICARVMEERVDMRMTIRELLEKNPTEKMVAHLQAVRDALFKRNDELIAERTGQGQKEDKPKEKVDGQANASGKDAPERKVADGPPPAAGDKRKACVEEIRSLWQTIGKEPGKETFSRVCGEHGRPEMVAAMLVKPANDKGPTDELLVAIRNAFRQQAGKGNQG